MGKRMKRHHQTCLLAQSDNTCLLQGREGACVLAVVVVRRSRPCAIQMWRCMRSTRLNDVLVAYTGAVTSDHSCILGVPVVLQSSVGAAYELQEIHW